MFHVKRCCGVLQNMHMFHVEHWRRDLRGTCMFHVEHWYTSTLRPDASAKLRHIFLFTINGWVVFTGTAIKMIAPRKIIEYFFAQALAIKMDV